MKLVQLSLPGFSLLGLVLLVSCNNDPLGCRDMYTGDWAVIEHFSYSLNGSLIAEHDSTFTLTFEKNGGGCAKKPSSLSDCFTWGCTEIGITIQPPVDPFNFIEEGFYFFIANTDSTLTLQKMTFTTTQNGTYERYRTWMMTKQ